MKPVEFDTDAFEDLAWWIRQDRKTALCTNSTLRRC
jgi:Txe/YoeB family toxin of Txe-Axe toxin-antitoxin module